MVAPLLAIAMPACGRDRLAVNVLALVTAPTFRDCGLRWDDFTCAQ